MRYLLLIGFCAALAVSIGAGSAAADPTAGPPICATAGQALTGTYYGDLKIKGDAYVPAGASFEVVGDLTLTPGACLDAFSTATVTLDGDVIVKNGATLALGCTPQSIGPVPPCGTTTTNDTVYGSIIANNPLTMYLDGNTIQGDLISHGGGPGPTLDPYINFPIKDNTILGDVEVTGWQGAWFGLLRNHINGSVNLANNVGVTSGDDGSFDSTEVTDNWILGSLNCSGNFPVAQIGDSGGGPNTVFSWVTGECATIGTNAAHTLDGAMCMENSAFCMQITYGGTTYGTNNRAPLTISPGTYWLQVYDDSNGHDFQLRSCPGSSSPCVSGTVMPITDLPDKTYVGAQTVQLKLKPGTYRLFCGVGNGFHESHGMYVDFTVG